MKNLKRLLAIFMILCMVMIGTSTSIVDANVGDEYTFVHDNVYWKDNIDGNDVVCYCFNASVMGMDHTNILASYEDSTYLENMSEEDVTALKQALLRCMYAALPGNEAGVLIVQKPTISDEEWEAMCTLPEELKQYYSKSLQEYGKVDSTNYQQFYNETWSDANRKNEYYNNIINTTFYDAVRSFKNSSGDGKDYYENWYLPANEGTVTPNEAYGAAWDVNHYILSQYGAGGNDSDDTEWIAEEVETDPVYKALYEYAMYSDDQVDEASLYYLTPTSGIGNKQDVIGISMNAKVTKVEKEEKPDSNPTVDEEKKDQSETKDDTKKTTNDVTNDSNTVDNEPVNTGDNSQIFLYGAMMLVSAAAIAGHMSMRNKK